MQFTSRGKAPCLVWCAPVPYPLEILSTSIAGLKIVAHRHLVNTGLFNCGGNAWVADRFDSLPGHLEWILKKKRIVDVSGLTCWRLLSLRAKVMKAGADDATLREVDATLAFYVRSTVMAPHVYASDAPPGISEWFVDADDQRPEPVPSTNETVRSVVECRLLRLLGAPEGSLAITLFDGSGKEITTPEAAAESGTFVVAKK